jgi:hypothetical protein
MLESFKGDSTMRLFEPRHFFLTVAVLLPSAIYAETINHTVSGKTETWNISEPVVTQPTSEYPQIKFLPGDSVRLQAQGCVQTGGHGSTWKRYVNPSGPNSDRLYYGTVWIPGVVGTSAAAQAKFRDVNGHTFSIPANANPAQTYLRLGYLDDGYSDNGYYSHDDGTEDQCKNQPNARVVITIVHGAGTGVVNPPPPTPSPFDLLSDSYDDNLIPLNPMWGYQKIHEGLPPSAEKLCARVISSGPGSNTIEYFPDQPPCTTQPTSRDDSWLCGPHGNWGPATVVGSIVWESHSTGTFSGDDDYSWYLTPPNGNGLTAARTSLEPEFNASETINNFNSQWWNDFHLAVDQGGTGPNTLIDGKLAIVSGLFSLDFEHDIHAEVHPVFAMALRVKEDPNDETWAVFVRRFGNEGFCSSNIHYLDYLPDNQFIFRLPLEWGAGATLVSEDLNFNPDANAPAVTFVPNQGVLLTFNMSENPAARQLVSGEIHLHWNNANTSAIKKLPVKTPEPGKEAGAEVTYQQLEQKLTPQQKAQLAASLPHPPVSIRLPVKTTMRHTTPVVGTLPVRPAGTRHPSVSSVIDNAKVQHDKALAQAFRKVAPTAVPPLRTPTSIPNAAASKP